MEFISSSPENTTHAINCLFGFFKNTICTYNPAAPPSFFSLGEAIGAFGLIFAVYQLTKPAWKIVLNIRPQWQSRLLFILSGSGLLFVGLAFLVTQLPSTALSAPFSYPSFFELLGFLCFIAAPSSYFYFATHKVGLFNKKTASDFYQVLVREIARANPETLDAVVNIIGSNLEEICIALKKLNRWKREDDNRPATEDEIFAGYANAVFDVILGDRDVANYIVTARLDFLYHLFGAIKKHSLNTYFFPVGIERIFSCLFANPKSYLYKQLERGGLEMSMNLYQLIFEDSVLLNHLNPFNYWPKALRGENEAYLPVYLKALEHGTIGYLELIKLRLPATTQGLVRGFNQLDDYLGSMWYSKNSKEYLADKFQKIEFFLAHTFPWDVRKVYQPEIMGAVGGSPRIVELGDLDSALSEAYAETSYQYLATLSRAEKLEGDMLRLYALAATEHLIGFNAEVGNIFEQARKLFLEKIWKQIEENSKGLYPAILPLYIRVVGMQLDGRDTSIAGKERAKVVDFLEIKIKPKILAGEKMGLKGATDELMEKALLPENVALNRTSGKFEYTTNS